MILLSLLHVATTAKNVEGLRFFTGLGSNLVYVASDHESQINNLKQVEISGEKPYIFFFSFMALLPIALLLTGYHNNKA